MVGCSIVNKPALYVGSPFWSPRKIMTFRNKKTQMEYLSDCEEGTGHISVLHEAYLNIDRLFGNC